MQLGCDVKCTNMNFIVWKYTDMEIQIALILLTEVWHNGTDLKKKWLSPALPILEGGMTYENNANYLSVGIVYIKPSEK